MRLSLVLAFAAHTVWSQQERKKPHSHTLVTSFLSTYLQPRGRLSSFQHYCLRAHHQLRKPFPLRAGLAGVSVKQKMQTLAGFPVCLACLVCLLVLEAPGPSLMAPRCSSPAFRLFRILLATYNGVRSKKMTTYD